MVKIAVVDDNKKDANVILEYIDSVKAAGLHDICVENYDDSLQFVEKFDGSYDIVFLDIEMPFLDGMNLARKLREMGSECIIVFITNMPQYALQGYEVDAIAYLIKPVKYFNFCQILKKAVQKANQRKTEDASIVVNTRQECKVLQASAIQYIEVENHNLVIHMKDGTQSVMRTSLKTIEEQLEHLHFARCNNCYLVNLRYVASIVGNTVRVGGDELLISRHKKKDFVESYMRYTR